MKLKLFKISNPLRRARGRWRSLTSILTGGALLASVLTSLAAPATFTPLGLRPGGTFTQPFGVSDNGTTVVGWANSTFSGLDGLEAFRWTAAGGLVGLGDFPPNDPVAFEVFSTATKVSADGSVVVGDGTATNSATLAYRWTQATGLVSLGDFTGGEVFSQAKSVSADGSVVVGYSDGAAGNEAFRWTQAGGLVSLGQLPGGAGFSLAWDVSADGTVVVGQGDNADGRNEAWRWTQATAMTGLGDLPGGTTNSVAYAISANGQYIVGSADGANGRQAVLWIGTNGPTSLGDLPGESVPGRVDGVAYDVSDNGVVVGISETLLGAEYGFGAFIWDAVHGIRNLQSVLTNNYGLNLDGWTLTDAHGITPDGRTIIGSGTNPDGKTEAWLVQLPVDIKPAGFLVHRLGLTNSASDSASKINDLGQITGTVDGTDGVSRGYSFSTATGQELERAGYPGSDYTEWGGINSAGTLAGYYADPADPNFETYRAFVRDSNGVYTAITWPGDPDFGFTVDIDEHGRAAGGGGTTAWVWNTNGTFNVFSVPGYSTHGAFGMNDHGLVVGTAWPGFFDTPNGLIYNISNNTATIWNYPGAAQTTLYGINNRGDIVGEFKPNLLSANTPFVRWADGTTQVLSFPGLASVRVYDINDDRVVVGRYKDAANKNRSFYATPLAPLPEPLAFTFQTFDLPGASETLLSDIRNDGTLVGRFKDGGGISQGFVQSGTNLTVFNVTGTTATFAGGIDSFGRIAGFYRDAVDPDVQHGFIRQTNGTFTTLDGPGQNYTYAWRINDAGQVNGYWFEDPFFITSFRRATNGTLTTNVFAGSPIGTVTRGMNEAGDTAGWKWDENFVLQGVIFAGGATNVFTVPGWENTLPGDINNLGDIAGTVNNGFTNTAGFFRRADGVTVTFNPPGAVEVEVFGMNDLGQVVGEYADAGGARHGFIACPAVALERGHTDVGIAYEDGEFNLHIHDEETDTEYTPKDAALIIGGAAEQPIPDTAALSFLGRPGYSTWILPAVQNTNLLFLGFGAEEIESGVFVGDVLRMELVSVVGAGDFAVFVYDGFSNPVIFMNSADGISAADFFPLVAGGHTDLNWAFSAPGTYRIGFRVRGTLVAGNQAVESDIAYYTFVVPSALLPQPPEVDDSFVYNVVDIGTFGGTAFANALGINNAGVVVGGANYPDNNTFHPYRFSGVGPKEDLGTAGGPIAGANDINEAGEITGTTFLIGGGEEPFAYYLPFRYTTNGVMQAITNVLGGLNGEATAINESGRIVGAADIALGEYDTVAFYADADNVMHSLGTFGGTESRAENINDAGYIVGNAQLTNGQRRAFRHLGGGPLNAATDDLGTLGGNRSQAHAINAAGKVTGTSRIAGNGSSPAFLWEEGVGMTNLGTLGSGTLAYGFGINSNDVVVGWSVTVSNDFDTIEAFIWDREHGMRNLNDLVPRGLGLRIDGAYAINDQGWIAGSATRLSDGAATPILLKPATRLSHGHTDIGIAFEDGAFDLHVHAEDTDTEYTPGAALLTLPPLTQTIVPTNASYAFLGTAGSATWILPPVQNPKLLFLGFGAEEIESGVFASNLVTMKLKSVDGPGAFSVFSIDGFGVPVVHMNSGDGIDASDVKSIVTGSHEDFAWGFTRPGYYRVTFEACGMLVAGDEFTSSGDVTYYFEVIGIETQLAIARSGGDVSLSFLTQDGLTYQLESAPAVTGPWTDEGAAFLGTGRAKQITVPLSPGAQFFKMKASVGN